MKNKPVKFQNYRDPIAQYLRAERRVSVASKKKQALLDQAFELGAPIRKPIEVFMSPRAKKPRVVVIRDNCPSRKAETVFRAKAFCRYEVVDYKPAKKKKKVA